MPELSQQAPSVLAERYAIVRELGRGATATVYLAHDRKYGRDVAVKVLHAELAYELGAERFLREIDLTARLQHPNILAVLDSGEAGSREAGDWKLFCVMPVVRGESLRDRLQREKQLPIDDAMRIILAVADGLAYAHEQGVVHRDIKPENVLLAAGDPRASAGGTGHVYLADFGIARAIGLAGSERLTTTGLIVGTPAYMSPEQASGDAALGPRSDLYSLACVLYEMLAGMPPFVGPTPQSVIAQRFAHAPTPVRQYRESVPPHVAAAIERAMALTPADRFPDARAFAAALVSPPVPTASNPSFPTYSPHPSFSSAFAAPGAATPSAPAISAAGIPSADIVGARPRRLRWVVTGAVVVAATAAGIAAARPELRSMLTSRGAPADSSRVAILPFDQQGQPADRAAATTQAAQRLYYAFTRWTGLELADEREVSAAVPANGAVRSLEDAFRVAKRVHARRIVWGVVDGGLVRASLYDVPRRARIRDVAIPVALAATDTGAARFAAALLRVADQPTYDPAGDAGTSSFAAWQAYGRGHEALKRWELERARTEFAASAAADASYAQAQLWLAQVLWWTVGRGGQSDEWRAAAERVMPFRAKLGGRDATLADALDAMAQRRYPDACRAYDQLRMRDSLDAVAWLGLGDCQYADNAVLADARSPSGWTYRTSYHSAVRAYLRALQLAPTAHAALPFPVLEHALPPETNYLRPGIAPGAASTTHASYPSLDHDTLAFVPYPLAEIAAGSPRIWAPSWTAALARNQAMLLDVAATWTRQFPNSFDAFAALARTRELRGEVGDARPEAPSALDAAQRAFRLAPTDAQRITLAIAVTRVLVKRSEFERARARAESTLAAWPKPPTVAAADLAGLAALTGRLERTAQLLRIGANVTPVATAANDAPPAVLDASKRFEAYAALGACDSLATLEARVERALESYVEDARRAQVREAVMEHPLSMAVPCVGASAASRIHVTSNRLVRMQQALAANDLAALRAHFDTLQRTRAQSRPGAIAIDYTYQEAWLRAEMGDTTAATKLLDLSLDALPSLGLYLLNFPEQAAGLVRAMAFRAELAARRRDPATARRWGQAVATLWATADAPLAPVVSRMRALAAGGTK